MNLSPADLPKEGGRFDLPIAVGILSANGKIPPRALQHREFYGELSLGGELRQTPKLLPALVQGSRSGRELVLPFANALEAALVRNAKPRLAEHLRQVYDAVNGRAAWPAGTGADGMGTEGAYPEDAQGVVGLNGSGDAPVPDLAEVRGQFAAKRALEIAAAGGHALLMMGPPAPARPCSPSDCPDCCRP